MPDGRKSRTQNTIGNAIRNVQRIHCGGEVGIEAYVDATVLVMNGRPTDEPIAGYGPFVMNTPQQIQRAIADYNAGQLGKIPALAQ